MNRIEHEIDDNSSGDASKGIALGGTTAGAVAGSVIGPVGTLIGAAVGALSGAVASGAAVAAVNAVDNDDTVLGVGTGASGVVGGTREAEMSMRIVEEKFTVPVTLEREETETGNTISDLGDSILGRSSYADDLTSTIENIHSKIYDLDELKIEMDATHAQIELWGNHTDANLAKMRSLLGDN